MALYARAITGRFGLGHGLLAWARSVVWAQQNNAQLIAPNWLQLRIGPYLRRERDKRFYYKLFQSGQQVGGLRRAFILAKAKRINISNFTSSKLQSGTTIVEFYNALGDNEAKHFHEILGHAKTVRTALLDMTKLQYRPEVQRDPHIAVHIRGGDFGVAVSIEQLQKGGHNLRLPVGWYRDAIVVLRDTVGQNLPVVVFSDCGDTEIAEVLNLANVKRSTYKESITDMLAMSQATVLVSSGSGFSRWGSYLGQVPRICYPGQRGVRVIGPFENSDLLEPEILSAQDLSQHFISALKSRIDNPWQN